MNTKLTVEIDMAHLPITLVLCICFYFLGRYEVKAEYNRLQRQLNKREMDLIDLIFLQYNKISQLTKEIKKLKGEFKQ